MTAANEELVSRNLELTAMKEHHADLRHRLGTPALLLFGLTFLFSIPLILTISGVIPFFYCACVALYFGLSASNHLAAINSWCWHSSYRFQLQNAFQ